MSQSQFGSQSFADVQQQVKELRQKYIGELEGLQAKTSLLLAEQQREINLLRSRLSHDTKQVSVSLHLLSRQFEADSTNP